MVLLAGRVAARRAGEEGGVNPWSPFRLDRPVAKIFMRKENYPRGV